MFDFKNKKILVLSPHTDDGEIACGGTIAKMNDTGGGSEIHWAIFSTCEESVPEGFPKDALETESRAATKFLGVKPENLTIFHYPVRRFSEHRQDILEDMVKINRRVHPDLVFLPSEGDIHQDHHVIACEGKRAFKKTNMLAYEEVWNDFHSDTTFLIALEKQHVEAKIAALNFYESQKAIRNYVTDEFIESWARVRGVQMAQPNVQFAEAFSVIRLLAI